MNAKMFRKTAFYLMFITAITLLVCCFGFSAFAADCDHPNLDDNKWTVALEPTCINQGIIQQKCSQCEEMVKVYVDAVPGAHKAGEWTTQTVHTCANAGVDVRKCIYCLTVVESRVVPAHDYSVLYSLAATCMRTGYEIRMCTTCYDMVTENFEIDPDAHRYGDWYITTEATCKEGVGVRTRDCINTNMEADVCGSLQTENYVDDDNHVNITWYEEDTVAPDCNKDGYTPGICNDCDTTVRKILPQHSTSDYTVLTSTPATCHESGVERRLCECGYEYDFELLPDENSPHEFGEWKIVKQANCTDGLRERHCKYHYKDGVETQVIPATGEHDYSDWVTVTEPDCTRSGLKEKTCSGCDDIIRETIPATHQYTEWEELVAMSCKDGAVKTGLKRASCNNCNYSKNFTVPAIHTYGNWVIVERADCKTGNPGIKERTCINDGCGYKETVTYTMEHNYTEWFVTTAPICATGTAVGREGIRTRWCQTCKTKETKAIPATHEFGEVEILDYYTCDTDLSDDSVAYNAISYCKFCNLEKQEKIAADHIYGEWVTVVNPDCSKETDGLMKRFCKNDECEAFEEKVIEYKHELTAWEFEGSCESGITSMTRSCTGCDYEENVAAEGTEGKLPAHPNLRTNVVAPTCTTSGHKEDYCPNCNYSRVYDIVHADGHNLSEQWYTMIPASCISSGAKYKSCSECDYIEFVKIERAEHILVSDDVGYEPTCTTPGLTPKSMCVVCKQEFEAQEVPPRKHVFENGACVYCRAYESTVDENGNGGCVCSCHSTDGLDRIIFMIINKLYQLMGINQECACGELHYEEVGFIGQLLGRGQTEEK